jgi:hypothetical protein
VLNHAFSWSNEKIRSFLKFIKLGLLTMMLVSSSNKTGLELLFTALGKSLCKRETVLVQALIPGAHHVQPSPILKEN